MQENKQSQTQNKQVNVTKKSSRNFGQCLKGSLAFLDPNVSSLSRTKVYSTWIGILVGFIIFIFLFLLLISKLTPVLNYDVIYVQGYQLGIKADLTVDLDKDRFGLDVVIDINGQTIQSKDALDYGLNVTFCNVIQTRWTQICYQMVARTWKPDQQIYQFVFPPQLTNFTIEMFYDWYIGVSKCSKRADVRCNQAYEVKEISLKLSVLKYTYNLFQRQIKANGGDILNIPVHRNMETQKCKYINIFFQRIEAVTQQSIFPSFISVQQQMFYRAQVSQYQTVIGQQVYQNSICGEYLRSENYLSVIISRSANNWIYNRSFRKIDSVFAEIFGLSSILFLISRILLSGYNQWSKNEEYLKIVKQKLGLKYSGETRFYEYFTRLFRNKDQKQNEKKLFQIIEQGTNPAEVMVKNAKMQAKIEQLQKLCLALSDQVLKLNRYIDKPQINKQQIVNISNIQHKMRESIPVYSNSKNIINLVKNQTQNKREYIIKEKEVSSDKSLVTQELLQQKYNQ